jgi:HTH-type transcriptional regulator/antitoxin HigA
LVSQRSRIYSKLPVNEIIKRGWIERTDNVEGLENRVLGFLEIRSLDETPKIIPHAARKSTSYDAVTSSQLAWLFRAKKLAARVDAEPYTVTRLRRGMERLKSLLRNPDDVRHVPGVLAESGVRFMVIEHLPKTRIDGCAFWLDTKSPVIVLSLRFDRIDCFWYTLIHDLYHIVHKDVGGGDEPLVDSDLGGTKATPSSERPANEQRADRGAAEFLVPQAELEEFIQRTGPRYSKSKIAEFADQLQVHPGLVVGQLQYRREISFSHSREMLVRIRDIITDSALTDGWGYAPA